MILIVSIATFILSILAIYGWYKNRKLHLAAKPLTTLSIIFLAGSFYLVFPSTYGLFIVLGLFLSVFGDSFLMFEEKYFIHGLVSFLLAHILYIAAFVQGEAIHFYWLLFLLILAFGIIYGNKIIGASGELKIPVAVYLTVIITMLYFSWERYISMGETGMLHAAIGATIFVVSDSVLAWDKFVKKFPSAKAVILSTYYLGQWLIAMSVAV